MLCFNRLCCVSVVLCFCCVDVVFCVSVLCCVAIVCCVSVVLPLCFCVSCDRVASIAGQLESLVKQDAPDALSSSLPLSGLFWF